MARSLLKGRQVPSEFWGEAVVTAVYLLNRAPTRSLAGRTPYEAWHGVKLTVEHLRTFGCVVHVKTVKPHLNKLEDRSKRMVLLGYEQGTKAYRVFDPVTRRVHAARDVLFDEAAHWDWGTDADGQGNGEAEEFVVKQYVMDEHEPAGGSPGIFTHLDAISHLDAACRRCTLDTGRSSRAHDTASAHDVARTHDARSSRVRNATSQRLRSGGRRP
jgi:hypothetical protein